MKNKRLQYNNGGGLNLTTKTIGDLNLRLTGQYSNQGSAASVGLQKNNSSLNVNIPTNKGGGYNITGQTKFKDVELKSNVGIGSGTGSVSATKNNITLSAGRRQSKVPTYGKENFVDVTFNKRF